MVLLFIPIKEVRSKIDYGRDLEGPTGPDMVFGNEVGYVL